MARTHDDVHFRSFAFNLESAISKYGDKSEEDLVKMQRAQVEKIVRLETEFRRTLIAHPWGVHVYKAFIRYIRDEERNTLVARPFFRERQTVFTSQISDVLQKRAEKGLYKFHFNYRFVLFTMDCYDWEGNRSGARIVRLAKEIRQIRTELIEMNMPLAISRARIFWSRTPKAQLSFMDLVQICSEGLMSAVDKFVLPYSTAFRAVAIGRMLGNSIEQYSETLVHFFPVDKRKIYRANKIISRFGENPDFEKVAEEVNKDVDPGHRTNAAEIADLMSASSTVSADAMVSVNAGDEEGETAAIQTFQAAEDTHPDVRVEQAEALMVMTRAIFLLPLTDQKLLRMKGVSL